MQGPGVLETLTACCKLILKQLDEGSAKKEGPIIKIFREPEQSAEIGPVIRITSEPTAEEPIRAAVNAGNPAAGHDNATARTN